MAKKISTYSLADTTCVINHPNVGQKVLSDEGGGRISFSWNSELSSHTKTASNAVTINKIGGDDGTVTIETAQNSESDLFLRHYVAYLKSAPASYFALGTLTCTDTASGITYNGTGVTPQKQADIGYDQTSGTITYTFLVASLIMQ